MAEVTDLPKPFACIQKAVQLLSSDSSDSSTDSSADHDTALIFIADAFHNVSTLPLHMYRAAACLREAHLRQVALILIFRDSRALPAAARLLMIMHGLPGNEELINDLVSRLKSTEAALDSQTLAIVSFLAGRAIIESSFFSTALSKSFSADDPTSKLALAFAFSIHPGRHYEHISDIQSWKTELPFSSAPSFWRELKWAEFARSKSVATGANASVSTSSDAGAALIDYLPESAGLVNKHYLRICGIPMRRRQVSDRKKLSPSTVSPTRSQTDSSFVVTSVLKPVLHNISIALGHGLPFVLEGQTGCGKTCLLSHLARETTGATCSNEPPGVTFVQMDSVSRDGEAESFDDLVGGIVPLPEGKGFRWRPGPIGLAVQRGEWVILENISRCTSSPSAISLLQRLASLRVGHSLEAPGRGEPIRVAPGFRCVATRTTDSTSEDVWQPPGGPDLWLRFEMPSPSDEDVTAILTERFPRVSDCIDRVLSSVKAVAAYTARHSNPIFVHPNIRQASRICGRLDNLRCHNRNLTAEMALQECMDTLVGWCADDKHSDNLINIIAPCWSLTREVAKGLFSSLSPSYCGQSKELQIGRATYPLPQSENQSTNFTLALTSHTLRLLERLLRCFQMNENILLTGEAGSGKTAVLQELASLFGKELVIVNLSKQSELSDLLGGFKPVEMAALISNLCRRFEELFCSCFTREKNHRFLDTLQRASRVTSEQQRALRLMKGAINAMRQRVKQESPSAVEWSDIAHEVDTLERSFSPAASFPTESDPVDRSDQNGAEPPRKRSRSLKSRKRRRVEFRFSEGVLVRAMREGKWILLDEINLAPSELLERLISVVDRGQVLLSNENGDVVNQAEGFMMFGAMNPPTDAGKRPLPAVLRTRFSEFYVGDVKDVRDVTLLVLHRFFKKSFDDLSTTREENNIAEDVARFFLHCCQLSREGRVEDTSGKPVRFSVRTLSRMLDFASGVKRYLKPGKESIRRALFEGALVAFATSLPRICKSLVVMLAKKNVLRPSKTVKHRTISAMMSIPQNQMSSIRNVEGFPIDNVSVEDQLDEASNRSDFIISPMVKNTLTDICRAMLVGAPKYPILLQGPTAAGKTSVVTYIAETTGAELIRINNHEHTELTEYIGGYVVTEEGSLQFSEGPLVRAARHGHWVLLDELNLAPPDVLEALNRLLDDNREIFIPETGEVVKAAPGFRLFATQNPPTLYGGRKELSRAFRSRFVEVHVDDLPDKDLLMILERKASIPSSFAKGMVSVMRELQLHRRSSGMFRGREGFVTARDLFRWSLRQPRSREELAVHGFLLLGERARQSSEREVVRDVMVKALRISPDIISDQSLYNLSRSTERPSPSEECLDLSLKKLSLSREKLFETVEKTGIVLTPHMNRMITLIVHCMANREPVLLVGATGSGKTSCCEILCMALEKALLSINCHRHTEASDIVGGFRPVRSSKDDGRLFEWCDGPLIEAMKKGNGLLIDEINMAEDAVIERLNSVLEHGRSFLLSEKGSAVSASSQSSTPDLIVAHPRFLILATMNPGGDFGKRELSPALRNRFTEMWIPQPTSIEDYAPIVKRRLSPLAEEKENVQWAIQIFLHSILTLDQRKGKNAIGSFFLTLRDLRAWCDFIVDASNLWSDSKQHSMSPLIALMHGAQQVFLDGLKVGSLDPNIKEMGEMLSKELIAVLPRKHRDAVEHAMASFGSSIEWMGDKHSVCLKINDFVLYSNPRANEMDRNANSAFSFNSVNTRRNTARLVRAICVGHHPILLEGPPGGGKTSLVAALAMQAGFQFIRVNLSETTEMSDLVGGDAPGKKQGTFSFREGPLLKALKEGHWLLLDELNLASQTVLEGLNSVLDHRRSVFVPELNKEIAANEAFRVFGAQNPAAEGSGRRGLPKSFLNRFTKVWIEPPSRDDTTFILLSLYPDIPSEIRDSIVKMIHLMQDIQFNYGIFGLRDVLRWCDVLSSSLKDHDLSKIKNMESLSMYLNESFDAVILQRLDQLPKQMAVSAFEKAFGFPFRRSLYTPSISPQNERDIRIGISTVKRIGCFTPYHRVSQSDLTVLSSRLSELQALSLSIRHGWPTAFFSETTENCHTRSEGRRLFEILAAISGKQVRILHGGSLANGDDFVGGYCQQDLAWILRTSLQEWRNLLGKLVQLLLNEEHSEYPTLCRLSSDIQHLLQATISQVEDCAAIDISSTASSFVKASIHIMSALDEERNILSGLKDSSDNIRRLNHSLHDFLSVMSNESFASFEWRKSDLLTSIEAGDWIFIEDADQCPPAVLDRLNPLFERAPLPAKCHSRPLHPEKILLAEAPSNEEGTSVYLRPHQEFRMAFSVRSGHGKTSSFGLSRALLDRSLRIDLQNTTSELEYSSILSYTGLSSFFQKKDLAPWFCGNHHVQACRMRLTASMGTINKCSNHIENGELVFLKPLTSSLALSFHPDDAILEIDLSSLYFIENATSEFIECQTNKVLKLLPIPQPSNIFTHGQPTSSIEKITRSSILSAAAYLFILSSSSIENAKKRAFTLKVKGEGNISTDTCNSYVEIASEAEGAIKDRIASGCQEEMRCYGMNLDPVFSLDSQTVDLHPHTNHLLEQNVIMFRIQTLLLERLRALWKHGQESTVWGGGKRKSLFALAKTSCELEEDKSSCANSSRHIGVAYQIVKAVVENIHSVLIPRTDISRWNTLLEENVRFMLTTTVQLCEILTGKSQLSDSKYLITPLLDWDSALSSLGKEHSIDKTLYVRLLNLREEVRELTTSFIHALTECGTLLMPRTDKCQELEASITKLINVSPKETISLSEVDAITKAVVTVRSKDIETNPTLIHTFEEVADSIHKSIRSKSLCPVTAPISHWSELTKLIALNSLWDVLSNLAKGSGADGMKYSVDYASRILKRVQPSFSHALFAVQRLQWIIECGKLEDAIGKQAGVSILKPFISSTLRAFASKLRNDDSESTTMVLMRISNEGSKNLFWDLDEAWKQSRGACSLTVTGAHHVNDFGTVDQCVLLKILSISLAENGCVTKTGQSALEQAIVRDGAAVATSSLICMLDKRLRVQGKHESVSDEVVCLIKEVLTSLHRRKGDESQINRLPISVLTHLGMLWALSGILCLQQHFNFINSLQGMDPCVVAQSVLRFSAQTIAEENAKQCAYEVLRQNRLGGDHPTNNIPVNSIKHSISRNVERVQNAYLRVVERPANRAPFSSYEATVVSTMSMMAQLVEEDGLLKRIICGLPSDSLKHGSDQLQMSKNSCEGLLSIFEIGASMSHFRDISPDFEFGLSQCAYGFSLISNALLLKLRSFDEGSSSKLNFFSSLCLFPRGAFHGRGSEIPHLLNECLKAFENGPFLLTIAKYYVGSVLRDGKSSAKTICASFDTITSAWKKSLLSSEEETERKSSLYILREATQLDGIIAMNIVKGMEQDEEADFFETFNPITNDMEDGMLGVRDETTNHSVQSEMVDVQNDCKVRLNPSEFWELHHRAFPSERGLEIGAVDVSSCFESMMALSSQFYRNFKSVPTCSKDSANIWNTVCSMKTIFDFSKQSDGASYNFYKSSNVSELAQMSAVLHSCLNSIDSVQKSSFKDAGPHPVLEEVSVAIERVAKSCRADTPLSYVVLGIENVLRKADEWHRLFATKETRIDSDTETLSRLVVRWRKLEMSSWPLLLKERRTRQNNKASKWFFLLYDVIINHNVGAGSGFDEWKTEIPRLVDKFLRSSPLGEFICRVHMVLSLSKHLSSISEKGDDREEIARLIHNIASFYAMYIPGIEDYIDTFEKPIFKKLSDYMKLVKWTATEDLGSSQKMSKEKNKYLEYYRLKAASEKTRRRLHKLCLDVDAVLRKPCYEYLSKDIAQIGLKTLTSEDTDSSKKSACGWSLSFSKRIPVANDKLYSILRKESISNEEFLRFCSKSGLLSRISQLSKRMAKIGVDISESGGMSFSLANKGIGHLRSVIKQHVNDLRSSEGANIQKKQRSFVELLRALRKMGLSPFGFSSIQGYGDLNSFFSNSIPTNCKEFNDVADDLLMVCVRQVRRLHEVSDARVRNSDISRDDSSKAVSFCNQLLTQSSVERKAISECAEYIMECDNSVAALQNLYDRDSEETPAVASIRLSYLTKLKDDIRRMRRIGDDFNVFKYLLRSASLNAKLPSIISSSEAKTNLDVSLQKLVSEESASDLKIIFDGISSCCAAFDLLLNSEDVVLIDNTPSTVISLCRKGLARACLRISDNIKELASTLSKTLLSVSHLTSANLLSLLIEPTLKFIRSCRQDVEESMECSSSGTANDCGITILKIKKNANALIERILISTQQTLTWAGIDQHTEMTKLNEEEDIDELPKNSVSISHKKLKTLFSVSGLSEVCGLLSKNEHLLEQFVMNSAELSRNKRREIFDIQSTLGRFLRSYLNDVLTPIFTKCTRYHCNALSLLRTLSSLIVGLFVEGYCRPSNEVNSEDIGDDHEVSGTGFGDVEDGDISTAQNVSDQIEDEEQLLGLKNDDDENNEQQNEQQDDKRDHDAFDMTTDFEGQMEDAPNQDGEKDDDNEDATEGEDIEKQLSKQLEKGKDVLDERLWGEDDERADEAEDADKKDGDSEGKQKSSDLVANEEIEENGRPKSREERESQQKDHKNNPDDGVDGDEDECDNKEAGNSLKNESDGEEADDDKEESSRKKGTNGKPLDDDEDKEDESTSNDGGEGNEPKENGNESNGQKEHDNNGDCTKHEDTDIAEDENTSEKNDIDMEDGSTGGENDAEKEVNPEGDADDEEMVGDSTHGIPETSEMQNDEGGNNKENEEEFGDNNGDLDLGNLSGSDSEGSDKHDGDGAMDMDEGDGEGKAEEDSDSNKNEHGRGDDNTVDDDENAANAMDMTEGTATTMQSGQDGHQAFQDDGHSTTNLNNDNNQAPDEETANGIGSEDVTGKSTGNGTTDPSVGEVANGENDKDSPESGMQDPNPLRALTDEKLVEHWQDVLDKLKQAQDRAGIDNEGESAGKDSTEEEDKGGEWEFATEDEQLDDDVAIGAATEEQHKALPIVDEEEENDKTESNAEDPKKSTTETETDPRQAQSRNNNTEEEQDGNEAVDKGEEDSAADPGETQADVMTVEHPARQAAAEETEVSQDMKAAEQQMMEMEIDEIGMSEGVESERTRMDGEEEVLLDGRKIESLGEEEARDLWRAIDKKVGRDASILCEELRLVLEATERSGMGGGYRSGKRLNMRKVIEFVASDFRKDRIWMRRVRAEKRAYDVMLAIDDSASMAEGTAGFKALEAAALVTSALGKLEVGRVAISRFGAKTKAVREFDSDRGLPLSIEDGGAMLRQFTFCQRETDVVDLLQFVQERMGGADHGSGSGEERLSLVLVISDGHLSKREQVARLVRMLKERRVLVAFIIVDGVAAGQGEREGGSSKKSIFDVKRVEYDEGGGLRVVPYMDEFPVPFYVVVQNRSDLPRVMAESLRHWIEMASL